MLCPEDSIQIKIILRKLRNCRLSSPECVKHFSLDRLTEKKPLRIQKILMKIQTDERMKEDNGKE
jgi:hypothetical protein